MQSKFKQKFPMLRDRRNESERVRLRYPDRIPVIAEVAERSTRAIPQMRRNKFLVPKDLSAGQFIFTLRRRLNMKATVAIFLYVGTKQTMIPSNILMGTIYSQYKDLEDGFLYIGITSEETFG